MAVLANRIFYQDGKTPADSAVVGFESNRTRVVRYELNLDEGEQANHIKVVFAGDKSDVHIDYGKPLNFFVNNLNKELSFYFAISTDPDAFSNAGYSDIDRATGRAVFTQVAGYSVEENMEYKVTCEADVRLYPGTQYYFWVFPGFSNLPGGNYTWGWVYWNDVPIDITLSGNSGIAWVKTESGIKPALVYVRKNGSNKIATPYIRKNGKWYIGTGK